VLCARDDDRHLTDETIQLALSGTGRDSDGQFTLRHDAAMMERKASHVSMP